MKKRSKIRFVAQKRLVCFMRNEQVFNEINIKKEIICEKMY